MPDDHDPILERDGLVATILLAGFAVVAWVVGVVGLLCSECSRSAS